LYGHSFGVPAFATGAAVVTWTKLGDEFPAEARKLTSDEFRTHVEALCWSSWRLLDLRIPKADVRRFAEVPDADTAVAGLVTKVWWADRGDCWYVGLRFPEWQLERAVIKQRQEASALRMRRSRLHKAEDHSLCLAENCPAVTRNETRNVTRNETRDPGRVGSGYRPPDPSVQNQDQPQDQEQPLTNSQTRRVRQGPGTVADDARQSPPDNSGSATTGGNARARPGAAAIDKLAS
jgi:hypothetical protein